MVFHPRKPAFGWQHETLDVTDTLQSAVKHCFSQAAFKGRACALQRHSPGLRHCEVAAVVGVGQRSATDAEEADASAASQQEPAAQGNVTRQQSMHLLMDLH